MCTRACYVVPILSQINSSHFCHAVSIRYIVILSCHLQLLSFLLILEQKLSVCFFYYKSIMCFLWMLHFVIVREEERSQRVCEKRVLRGMFESKWAEVTRG